MKKIRTYRHGEATSPPLTYKQGPTSDGRGGVHYELSPFTKQFSTQGTFDKATKRQIDAKQKKEMNRSL